jgi:hypothetical protein
MNFPQIFSFIFESQLIERQWNTTKVILITYEKRNTVTEPRAVRLRIDTLRNQFFFVISGS